MKVELTEQEKAYALDEALYEKMAALERRIIYDRINGMDWVANKDYILGCLQQGRRP